MKNYIKYVLVLISLITLFTTCKKYPEGGYIKKNNKRLIGKWKLTLYEVNGIDSTNLINYMGDEGYKDVVFLDNANDFSIDYDGYQGGTGYLVDNNKQFEFYGGGINKSCIFYNNTNYCYKAYLTPEVVSGKVSTKWEILKLTKKELKLRFSGTNNYLLILTR